MIDDVIYITRTAGGIVKGGFGKNIQVNYKSSENNLVTEIDRKSEDEIIKFISKKFPSHSILAEERGELLKDSEYLWVIDPLDGTTNFAHGLPIFSVSIGLQKNGITVLGAVYDVMRDIMYSAETGSGAFANGKRINVSSENSVLHSVLVTGFPYSVNENPDKAFERFEIMTRNSRAVRRLGSAAIDFCYVASGVFEGFWEVQLHPWDICAGKLLVEEAGGRVSDFKGDDIDIYSKQILASNKSVHPQLIKLINKV